VTDTAAATLIGTVPAVAMATGMAIATDADTGRDGNTAAAKVTVAATVYPPTDMELGLALHSHGLFQDMELGLALHSHGLFQMHEEESHTKYGHGNWRWQSEGGWGAGHGLFYTKEGFGDGYAKVYGGGHGDGAVYLYGHKWWEWNQSCGDSGFEFAWTMINA